MKAVKVVWMPAIGESSKLLCVRSVHLYAVNDLHPKHVAREVG